MYLYLRILLINVFIFKNFINSNYPQGDQIQIRGYININTMRWLQAERKANRLELEDLWEDAVDTWGEYDDIFNLLKLFGMEPYNVDPGLVVEEYW